MDADPSPAPATVAPLPPGFELPTARQVVGRGLQLAVDHAADLRRASLYVGLLILATAGPAVLLFVADLPSLTTLPWEDAARLSGERDAVVGLLEPLFAAGSLAAIGVITVLVDGALVAVALLGSRAAHRPLSLRDSLQRARQAFWRYGFAAFVVGMIATIASSIVGLVTGELGRPESIGSNLFGSLVGTVVTAPFGYVLTAIVLGDVDGATALGRSVRLARARPRLAAVVAAFAFLSSTLQVLGLGIAADLADRVATALHPDLDLSGAGLLIVAPVVAVALVAVGSLALTVSAIAAAPQITAFLGLTHFSAGLDLARRPTPQAAAVAPEPDPAAERSYWQAPPASAPEVTRWVTRPMVLLVALEAFVVVAGLVRPH